MAEPADAAVVAVVGMGIAVPGAASPEEFWRLLNHGPAQITDPPPGRWEPADFAGTGPDKTYQQAGGFITSLRGSDDGKDAADYAQVWLRHCVSQALAEVTRSSTDRFSLCLGATADGSQHQEEALLRDGVLAELALDGLRQPSADRLRDVLARHFGRPGAARRYLPHRIARQAVAGILPRGARLHLIDTACSSSLYAIDLGARELLVGTVDVAVCGGALALTPTNAVLFAKNGGLAAGTAVRSLDAGADGVLFSDGAGVVVLKRLDRALADGDTIHGVLLAAGLSADGKGAAIYAPSAEGQRRAIRRALDRAGLPAQAVGLVVAHATGTPAGDSAELEALRDCYPDPRAPSVVSNKSLIGHTGWAAGVVSVIHLLLAMRQRRIPAQHGLREAAGAAGARVPREPVPWDGTPRIGAVSAFGFGGTNAHLLFEEYRPGLTRRGSYGERRRDRPADSPANRSAGGAADDVADDLVVIGYAARLPDHGTEFGDTYPAPAAGELRLPPPTVQRTDRTQLMLVQCVHRLDEAVREACRARADRVGVIVGHTGPTRSALLYRTRAHLDEIDRAVRGGTPPAGPEARAFLARHRAGVTGRIPPPTEDAYPGEMPNVIAGRLSNSFDLRGLNMTVDQGEASLLEAFTLAARYLELGDLDIALVGAASGNTLPAWRAALTSTSVPVHEGAFLFAVTTRSVAEATGLPILAVMEAATDIGAAAAVGDETGTEPGPPDLEPTGTFAGATGGTELVAFLSGATAAQAIELRRRADRDGPGPEHHLKLRRAGVQDRHVLSLAPLPPSLPRRQVRRSVPLVAPGTVVLTNQPALAPPGAAVIEVGADHVAVGHDPTELTEAAFEQVMANLRPAHLRVLVDLSAPGVLRLHDALFLAARACGGRLERLGSDASVIVLVLGGVSPERVPHPLAGLFTGFVKVLALELPGPLVLAVVHASRDPAIAVRDLETETVAERLLPVVYYAAGERLAVRARRQPAAAAAAPSPLTSESVVVAAGGGRGIGAEVLKALAREVAPRIIVLGSTVLDDGPGSDQRDQLVGAGRAAFIRAALPRMTVVEASAAFDRLLRAQEARATLAELAACCGDDRVAYHACDLRDAAAVQRVIGQIQRAVPRVDLLLNLAAVIGSDTIARKSLADFTAVRDSKLEAHANLAAAFGDRRPAMWCNFGSYAGFLGAPGASDYAAANDFLYGAAWQARAQGHDEYTIGFGLWGEAGLGASPLWRSHLGDASRLTPMPTVEGVGHFMAELRERATATVQLGQRERAAVERAAPGYLAWCDEIPDFFVGQTEARTADSLTTTRVFDLDQDGYLEQHVVGGYPTLPGTFYLEAAAQVARRLCPGRVPVAFTDLRLEAFLRVYAPNRPHPVRISAHRRSADTVHVRVTSDVIAPNGRLLVRDRLHASVDVRLRDAPVAAPHWPRWADPGSGGASLVNPLYLNHPAARLRGMFITTIRPRLHLQGRRARLRIDSAGLRRWIPATVTPLLELEGTAQLTVTQRAAQPAVLAVPRRIGAIHLYDAGGEPRELYGLPRDPDLAADPGRNRSVAVTPSGRVAVQVRDLTAAVLDRLPPQAQETSNDAQPATAGQAR